MPHQCPRNGCSTEVPDNRLACGRDWYQVPLRLRQAVYSAWRQGRGIGTPAHTRAVAAATAHLRQLAPR